MRWLITNESAGLLPVVVLGAYAVFCKARKSRGTCTRVVRTLICTSCSCDLAAPVTAFALRADGGSCRLLSHRKLINNMNAVSYSRHPYIPRLLQRNVDVAGFLCSTIRSSFEVRQKFWATRRATEHQAYLFPSIARYVIGCHNGTSRPPRADCCAPVELGRRRTTAAMNITRSVCFMGRGMIELVPKVITIVRVSGRLRLDHDHSSPACTQACYGRASKLYGVGEHLPCSTVIKPQLFPSMYLSSSS